MIELIKALGKVQEELNNLKNQMVDKLAEEFTPEAQFESNLNNVGTCARCGALVAIDDEIPEYALKSDRVTVICTRCALKLNRP